MKVLISADMEGTCGVSSWVQVTPPEYAGGGPSSPEAYERARRRMTMEVNAAVEGALAGGAEEVIINDSHDGMRNLVPEELHPSVRFVTGNDKELGMAQGVQEAGVGALFYTGYHARAGTPGGPLAHTWTGYVNDVRFDGRSTGEYGVNAAVAGHFRVPVVLVTGDEKAVAQTIEFVGEQCVGVTVKEGYATTSAIHLHPTRAQALIRQGAEEAMRRVADAKPWVMPANCRIEIDFDHQTRADQCLYIPGIERVGVRTIAWTAPDALAFIRVWRAAMRASGVPLTP